MNGIAQAYTPGTYARWWEKDYPFMQYYEHPGLGPAMRQPGGTALANAPENLLGAVPQAPVGGIRGADASSAMTMWDAPFAEKATQTVADPGMGGGLPWGKIATIAGAGLGLIGTLKNLQGIDMPYSMSDIDELITKQRRTGYGAIGKQLSQANVATAGNLASRGLGSSTIATGALSANRAASMDAIAELEGQLTDQQRQMLMQLAQLRQAEEMRKKNVWAKLADMGIGTMFAINPTLGMAAKGTQELG